MIKQAGTGALLLVGLIFSLVLVSGLAALPYVHNDGCAGLLPESTAIEVSVRFTPFGIRCLSGEAGASRELFIGPTWIEWLLTALAVGVVLWLTQRSKGRVHTAAHGAAIVIAMLSATCFLYLAVAEFAAATAAAFTLTFVAATLFYGLSARPDPGGVLRAGLAAGSVPFIALPIWGTLHLSGAEHLAVWAAIVAGAGVFATLAGGLDAHRAGRDPSPEAQPGARLGS